MTADAHLHLGDVDPSAEYPWRSPPDLVFTCTARPSEWMEVDYPHEAKRFYGVHPWYVGDWSTEAKETLTSLLDSDPSAGVGEIGMDDTRDRLDVQTHVFEDQLSIASERSRTVTVHMVGCEKSVLESIRRYGNGIPVILHAFKSESYVKPFTELNCYFSIGPRLLAKNEDNIRRVLSAIPEDRLLVETDAPHMPRSFSGLEDVLKTISKVTGVAVEDISRTTTENMRRIL